MRTQTAGNTVREVADLLKDLRRVAITTHVGVDGDAVGASIALVYLMRSLGAEAIYCHAEDTPNYLQWLLPEPQRRELPKGYEVLVVDTSRAERTGVPLDGVLPRLNLDHHADNPLYGEWNLVDGSAAASAGIVAALYEELGIPFEKHTAEAIYTGLRADTGGFRFRNMSPEVHEMVADLIRAGVVPAEVHDRLNRTGTIEQLRIVGVSLANAVRYGEAIITTVTSEDYGITGGGELDSKESIDHLRTVAGVDVVAHLREVPEGTKGSLRSETVDVARIATRFGGGGHRLAAGYTVHCHPEKARQQLLDALEGVVDLGSGI